MSVALECMISNASRRRWWWLRPQFRDEPQNLLEHLPCDGDLGHLEDDIASVAHDFRADLDQLLLQPRERPVLDRLWCCKRAEKVAKIVGERSTRSVSSPIVYCSAFND